MSEKITRPTQVSRRGFIRGCTAATALAAAPILESWSSKVNPLEGNGGPAKHVLSLDQDWLFGGKMNPGALQPDFNDAEFSNITLPHCAVPLSWQNWDPAAWEDVFIYRRHFMVPPEFKGQRLFLHFDRVLTGAGPAVNGHELTQHLGGFLPFEQEITNFLSNRENIITVAVDGHWLNVPPAGAPKGPGSIDYMLPPGISGSVSLRAVPGIFIRDVFAKPVNVLDVKKRRLEITCRVDAAPGAKGAILLVANLRDKNRTIASVSKGMENNTTGQEVSFAITNLQDIVLWDVDNPELYSLMVTLFLDNKPVHNYRTRVGFREARFDLTGFYLNGRRLQLFGLNRHELYPYVGFSAPDRVLRRDAEILRREFNCNIVRCSHYPQSAAFLDACDELGLMVWEEIPGWQYIGNQNWQHLALRDVGDMVRRDRNRPSVVIWGVRINESRNDPDLYQQTQKIAKALDDSRPTSGTMTPNSLQTWQTQWHQDVFAFDDYHSSPDGTVGIRDPLPGVPYMIAEAVGQFNYATGKGFTSTYMRAGDPGVQMLQAVRHAQAHSRAGANSRIAGVIAWAAFEYGSLLGAVQGVKYPGVADVFRLPKLGASFYLAQVDPRVRPVIEPNFYWDFGPQTPDGPGENVAIFSNCDRLELSIDGQPKAVLHPDRAEFPNLRYSPFFVNLTMDGSSKPELRIDGYVGDHLASSRSFSADRSRDRLWLLTDDAQLQADGADATRLAFAAVDKFGARRPFVSGQVSFALDGPGIIVGDNPFQLANSGGAGAVWVKTLPDRTGRIAITARHAFLGEQTVQIQVIESDT